MDTDTQTAHHKTVTEDELPELKEKLVKALVGTLSRTRSELPATLRHWQTERDELAARVNAFLVPRRSVSEGGHWGDSCPGALR